MLIGGILVIIAIALLIVKLVSGGFGGKTPVKAETSTESVQTIPTVKDPVDQEAADKEHEITVTPTPSVTPSTTPEPEAEEITKEVDDSMVTSLIKSYFDGLSSKDPVRVAACVDSFSDDDARAVTENTQITSYSDVEVRTCKGTNEKSRIAFVSYCYTVAGSDVKIPALTEFYVYDIGDGNWRLASDIHMDPAVEGRIEELMTDENVAAMIEKVQKEFNQVLAEHPELQSSES